MNTTIEHHMSKPLLKDVLLKIVILLNIIQK